MGGWGVVHDGEVSRRACGEAGPGHAATRKHRACVLEVRPQGSAVILPPREVGGWGQVLTLRCHLLDQDIY